MVIPEAPSPPPPAILTHNDTVVNTELQASRDAISQIHVALTEIDAEIARLSFARESIQNVLHQHKAVTSPLRRVPNEIISEIMKHYIQKESNFYSRNPTRPAVVLASVCSRWRKTAISTPQLWTKIQWLGSGHGDTMMQVILSRSGDCGLQLQCHSSKSKAQAEEFLQGIRRYHDRLSSIYDVCGWMATAVVICPSFRRLTTLHFECPMQVADILQAFEHCPALEEASICLETAEDHITTNAQRPLTMVQLRQLCLEFEAELDEFFDRFTAPNLTEFIGNNILDQSNSYPYAAFLPFLTRSKASLNKLDLGVSHFTLHQMYGLIDAAPHLSDLRIGDNGTIMKLTYEYLEFREGRPIILPRLERLVICSLTDFIAPLALHKMIESRAQRFPLKQVEIEFQEDEEGHIHFYTAEDKFAQLWSDADRLGYTMECKNSKGAVVHLDDGLSMASTPDT